MQLQSGRVLESLCGSKVALERYWRDSTEQPAVTLF